MDMEFTLLEMRRAINQSEYTAPGQYQLCYVCQLPDEAMKMVLEPFNKIWREGKMPLSWKKALILLFVTPVHFSL